MALEGSLPCSQQPVNGPRPEPVHTSLPHLSENHLNIVLPPMSKFCQWPLSFWRSHRNPVYTSFLPMRATSPFHLILLDLIILILFDEKYKLSIRSQWPRSLTQPAQKQRSWVRIPLEARMSVRLFRVCAVLSV
jgi:hypothetical protein